METPVQEPAQQATTENRPLGVSGLGGWLILIQIGLLFTLIMLLAQISQSILPILNTETWEMLTAKDSGYYHPLWGPIIIFEAVFNLLFLLFTVYVIVAFYQRKAILPRLMIIFYSVSLIVGTVDYLLLYQIPMARELEDGGSIRDIVRSGIACAIWIPYFIKSERVQNTFVR
ncbi:DUF2569 domain-containing protein [Paenibacillus barcinonensis]|uniref:DUF2569 domain-containing protein n=1 Tax=Paenibacillus barcinonensis TaxID=198119 RepID=A0A2V4V7L7_PAEBA|nr:DUF2569 domain-containing protein [Paenibacillus barcinonensis]PYE47821.1 uncharacterized protein DUF2569 [Paenibacillus barcinonensis]QKS59078.1 DUF2569 domain-containing protein [Paenibacillus barcinonensis]